MDFNVISNDIAIDLGSARIKIHIKGKGLVLDEPSVIAFDTINGEIIAAGEKAYEMIGREPIGVRTEFVLKNSVITDDFFAEEFLKIMIKKACDKTVIKPRIIISIHPDTTDVEKRALGEAAIVAGARKVYIIDSPIAAGIGAKCDVTLSRAMMLVDFGAGRCDISTIANGVVVKNHKNKAGADDFTREIITYFKDNHSLAIGYQSAERLKKEIGCVFSREKTMYQKVAGMDVVLGKIREIEVSSEDIKDALMNLTKDFCDSVKAAVSDVSQDMLCDILEDGILLTGGGALISGLVEKLKFDTDMKIFKAPEKDACVISGLATALENIEKLPQDTYTLYQA